MGPQSSAALPWVGRRLGSLTVGLLPVGDGLCGDWSAFLLGFERCDGRLGVGYFLGRHLAGRRTV
jgi:hypothetical protein